MKRLRRKITRKWFYYRAESCIMMERLCRKLHLYKPYHWFAERWFTIHEHWDAWSRKEFGY